MAEVVLDRLAKVYDNGFRAVDDLNLEINDGEFLVLVGPSGCGKSTALRMVAGLEDITEGELRINGRRMNETPSRDRDIAMVFQSYALYPHMSVYDNIAFGLSLRKVPKPQIKEQVERAATMLGLEELLDRRPKELSGGQRQRVAMGRAIVRDPQVFLMDEPLSNLDAKLRVQMRAEIAKLQREMAATTIYVTHDQVEAMTMGQRVAVMHQGILQQVAAPDDLYDNPVNLFVAEFIGSPPMNLVQGTLLSQDDGLSVQVGDDVLRLDESLVARRPTLRGYVGTTIAVGVRPEDMEDAAIQTSHPEDRRLNATVEFTEALGSSVMAHVKLDAAKVHTAEVKELAADESHLAAETDGTMATGNFSPRSRVRAGDQIEVAIDTSRLYLFDLESGLAIV